jgi:hypothetical protein
MAVDIVDRLVVGADALDRALHEPHARRVENRLERRLHRAGLGLVEAGADMEFRLRGDQRDLDRAIRAAMLLQHARGAERRPHSGKAGADDQDALGHFTVLPWGETKTATN